MGCWWRAASDGCIKSWRYGIYNAFSRYFIFSSCVVFAVISLLLGVCSVRSSHKSNSSSGMLHSIECCQEPFVYPVFGLSCSRFCEFLARISDGLSTFFLFFVVLLFILYHFVYRCQRCCAVFDRTLYLTFPCLLLPLCSCASIRLSCHDHDDHCHSAFASLFVPVLRCHFFVRVVIVFRCSAHAGEYSSRGLYYLLYHNLLIPLLLFVLTYVVVVLLLLLSSFTVRNGLLFCIEFCVLWDSCRCAFFLSSSCSISYFYVVKIIVDVLHVIFPHFLFTGAALRVVMQCHCMEKAFVGNRVCI